MQRASCQNRDASRSSTRAPQRRHRALRATLPTPRRATRTPTRPRDPESLQAAPRPRHRLAEQRHGTSRISGESGCSRKSPRPSIARTTRCCHQPVRGPTKTLDERLGLQPSAEIRRLYRQPLGQDGSENYLALFGPKGYATALSLYRPDRRPIRSTVVTRATCVRNVAAGFDRRSDALRRPPGRTTGDNVRRRPR